VGATTGTGMVLYPNPVDDLLSVQVTAGAGVAGTAGATGAASAAGKRTVQLTDMQGRVLQTQEVQLSTGVTTVTFRTAGLSGGGYLIVSTGADGTKVVQGFIKK
jgi:hypothetical protein